MTLIAILDFPAPVAKCKYDLLFIFTIFNSKKLVYLKTSLLVKMSKIENAENVIQKIFVGCNKN